MIVAEAEDRFRFTTQPDHADLAGQFAERWGNACFERPEPDAAMLIAAYNHDMGWWKYDRRPHLDQNGRPIGFREVPAETWIDLYEEGIDSVVELDAYAGLLVSLHGSGLRQQRYGLSPSWSDTPPEYRTFVDRQESLQARLLEKRRDSDQISEADATLLSTLHESGAVGEECGSRLWHNYKLLQAWDSLSLAFCTTTSPPSQSEVRSVPRGDGSGDATLSIEPLEGGEFRIDPYPLDTSPLDVSVPTRTVQKTTFEGDQTPVHAYYRAERKREELTVRSAE